VGKVKALGRRALALTADVTDRTSLERLLAATLDTFGKVDILVNSAGRMKRGPTIDSVERDWKEILDTNPMGVLRACRLFGRHMLERQYGRVINITSLNAFISLLLGLRGKEGGCAVVNEGVGGRVGRSWVCVNAIALGVFPTFLNSELLQSSASRNC